MTTKEIITKDVDRVHLDLNNLGVDQCDLAVREDELGSFTNDELSDIGISREELHRVFAKGMRMLQKEKRRYELADEIMDGIWPCAYKTRSCEWKVEMRVYSLTDPWGSTRITRRMVARSRRAA